MDMCNQSHPNQMSVVLNFVREIVGGGSGEEPEPNDEMGQHDHGRERMGGGDIFVILLGTSMHTAQRVDVGDLIIDT
jgi:hypothetical protein